MEQNLFQKLKSDGRLIDNEIKKLEKTWESPQNILCQRGRHIDEAVTKLNDFIAPVKKIRVNILTNQNTKLFLFHLNFVTIFMFLHSILI